MTSTLLVLLVYLAMLAGFAIWSRDETNTLSGYYLAGKKLPYWVVAFSTNATGESGWLLLGLTGMGYKVGAQAYWVVVGEIAGIALSWWLVARRLKHFSDETNSITVPDVLVARFQGHGLGHAIRAVAVAIILVMVTTYVTAQLVASGKALSGFVGMDYQTGVVVGAAIVIGYTFVGGFKAVSYTDVVQGGLMLAGLIVVPIVAVVAAGGPSSLWATLQQQDPSLLNPLAVTTKGLPGWVAIASLLAIGLPFMGVPQLLTRFMSANDDGEIKKARIVSVVVLLVFTIGAVTAGLAGRALYPGLADSETIFPTLSTNLFPAIVSGLLLIVVLSAIMSTVDSLLLLASSAVVRDTLQAILGSRKSEAVLAGYGKYATLVIGIVAIAFAVPEAKFIFWFVLFAWSGLGAAFGPVVVCLLYDDKTTQAGVLAGMLAGFLTSVLWVLLFKSEAYGLYEAIPGFIAGFAATIVVSRLTFKENRS